MRRLIARILAIVLAMSGIATVAQAAPQGALQRIDFGDSSSLTLAQETELRSYWAGVEGSGKFICSGLYLEGSDFDLRVKSRLQAKVACDFLSQEFGLENWYQAKPTAVASFVGSVYIRIKLDETAAAPDSDSDESSSESSTSATVSKTTSLPDVDFSSSTVSPEVADLAVEKIAALDSPSEVVCTSVVSPNFSAEQRERALTKAKKICEALAERTGSTVRHQVKASTSSWVGRVMLTSIWSPSSAGNSTAEDKKTEQETKSEESESEETAPAPAPNRPSRPVSRPPATSPVEQPADSEATERSESQPAEQESESEEQAEEVAASPTPSLRVTGLAISGQTMNALVDDLPEGAVVACSWHNNLSGEARQVFGSDCSVTVPENKPLYLDVSVELDGSLVLEVTAREICSSCVLRMINTPALTISGDRYVGSTLTASVGTIDEGAAVTCSWESRGSYNNTIYSRSCSYTPSGRMGSFYVRALVTKSGLPTWSSGWVQVGPVTLRPISPTPSVQILGTRRSGEVITASVPNLPDGATLSCSWYSPSSGYPSSYEWGSSCDLLLGWRSAMVASNQGLYVTTAVSLANHESWRASQKVEGIEQVVLSPTVQVSGQFVAGNTMTAVIENLPDGATVRCQWGRTNPRGSNSTATIYSSTCTLGVTESIVFTHRGGTPLFLRVTVDRTQVWNSWSGGIANVIG